MLYYVLLNQLLTGFHPAAPAPGGASLGEEAGAGAAQRAGAVKKKPQELRVWIGAHRDSARARERERGREREKERQREREREVYRYMDVCVCV